MAGGWKVRKDKLRAGADSESPAETQVIAPPPAETAPDPPSDLSASLAAEPPAEAPADLEFETGPHLAEWDLSDSHPRVDLSAGGEGSIALGFEPETEMHAESPLDFDLSGDDWSELPVATDSPFAVHPAEPGAQEPDNMLSTELGPEALSFDTPAFETPALETPALETPAIETPALETPALEAPAFEAPAIETPAFETPADITPVEDPVYSAGEFQTPTPVPPLYDREALAPGLVSTESSSGIPIVAPFIVDLPLTSGDLLPDISGNLVIRHGNFTATFVITKEVTTIGRPDSQIQSYPDIEIDLDDAVSRWHAQIRKRDDQYYLVDVGSTNGTLLNGEILVPHREVRLAHGDHIRVGERTEILFE